MKSKTVAGLLMCFGAVACGPLPPLDEATLSSSSLNELCQAYAYGQLNTALAPRGGQAMNELILRKEITTKQLQDIKAGTIRTGMPEHIAICSWGPYTDINSSGGIYGTFNQIVIGDKGEYIYTSNGRVESWQQ